MKKINRKLIIIKYGSNTLVCKNNSGNISIDYKNIRKHGSLISNTNHSLIIVSSGAVVFGKTFCGNGDFDYIKDEVIKKRIFSAIGNPYLSINWSKAIKNKFILQGLITQRDLISSDSRAKIGEIIHSLYVKNNAIIQVNDNDFVTDEELSKIRGGDFGDNDRATELLAELCGSIFKDVEVVINTNSDGVLENGKLVHSIKSDKLKDDYIKKLCGSNKSDLGTGGMLNKLKIIRDLMKNTENINVYIINGKKPDQLNTILNGIDVGTKIYNAK